MEAYNIMATEEEYQDFIRELDEKEAIYKMPHNELSISLLRQVKKSELSKRIDERYDNMTLTQFLDVTSIK